MVRSMLALAGLLTASSVAHPGAGDGSPAPAAQARDDAGADRAPISERGVENLAAFARLYGLVRYFHASDGVFDTDWPAFAARGASEVEGATTREELIARLNGLFVPVAPRVLVYPAGQEPPPLPLVRAEAGAGLMLVTSWRHEGLRPAGAVNSAFQSVREGVSIEDGPGQRALPDPLTASVFDLGGGVSARFPLSVFMNQNLRTLPLDSPYVLAADAAKPTLADRSTRLGAVVATWNAVQHFWPFFPSNPGLDWASALPDALREAARSDALGAVAALRRMLAATGDGQAWAEGPAGARQAWPPLALAWAENRLVVARVGAGADAAENEALNSVRPGDTVLAIEGVPAKDAIESAAHALPAGTARHAFAAAAGRALAGAPGTNVTVRLAGPEGERDATLRRTTSDEGMFRAPGAATRGVAEAVVYTDPARMSGEALSALFVGATTLRAIIVDLRGDGPGLGSRLGHLVSEPIEPPDEVYLRVTRPDRVDAEQHSREPRIQPLTPRLSCRLIALTDATTRGGNEVDAAVIQRHGLGWVVGGPTAGAMGEATRVDLPGGAWATFTCTMIIGPEGEPIFAQGVAPDVEVTPTVAGLRSGRDEALDQAVRLALSADQPGKGADTAPAPVAPR